MRITERCHRVEVFEPVEKATGPGIRHRMMRTLKGTDDPDSLPPILTRAHPEGFGRWQVVDGHRRSHSYLAAHAGRIRARVIPDEFIEDIHTIDQRVGAP